MHTLGFLGSFDRALCPAKYNYGQTLANLSEVRSTVMLHVEESKELIPYTTVCQTAIWLTQSS